MISVGIPPTTKLVEKIFNDASIQSSLQINQEITLHQTPIMHKGRPLTLKKSTLSLSNIQNDSNEVNKSALEESTKSKQSNNPHVPIISSTQTNIHKDYHDIVKFNWVISKKLLDLTHWLVKNDVKTATDIAAFLDEDKLVALFKCPFKNCIFTTNNSVVFRTHLMSYTPQLTYCLYCLKIYEDFDEYIKHIIVSHGIRIYQCSKCLYRAFFTFNVQVHQQMNHPEDLESNLKILKCQLIDERAANPYPEEVYAAKYNYFNKYICKSCNTFSSISKEQYHHHLNKEHKNNTFYKCQFCEVEYLKIDQHLKHLQCHEMHKHYCFYCSFGDNIKKRVFEHLCVDHADFEPKIFSRLT